MGSSKWIQLNIQASPQQTEQIEDSVLDAGAVSVTLQDAADQPILEPGVGETPLWDSCILTALFPASVDTSATTDQINAFLSFHIKADWQLVEDKTGRRNGKNTLNPLLAVKVGCGYALVG
jgi:ribosomal protein L11 methyltransferase